MTTPQAVFDPVLKRYKATCPECGYVATRAKREAAEHALSQHIAYDMHTMPVPGFGENVKKEES